MPAPLRVAIVNDYEIVVHGLRSALAPYADRVAVVELDSGRPVTSPVDVILYDTFGQARADRIDVDQVRAATGSRLVVFTWSVDADLVTRAVRQGVAGVIPKSLGGRELVEALERVAAGEVVDPGPDADDGTLGRWPGDEHGLTARESEVLALICLGLSNEEIGELAYIGINTVKTHIRRLYRKIEVQTRSQAVRWGMTHGFEPDVSREVSPG